MATTDECAESQAVPSTEDESSNKEVQKWLECAECRFPLVKAEELIAERCTFRTDVAWCYELDVFDQQVSCYSATNAHDHRFDVVRASASCVTRSIVQEGEATADFSWFPGFSWSMAHCANCLCHLGWAFRPDAPAPQEGEGDGDDASKRPPPTVDFFGLVLTKMREHQREAQEVAELFQHHVERRGFASARRRATSPRRELGEGLMGLVQTIQQHFRHFPLDEAMLTSLDETQRMLTRHRRTPEVVATPLRRSVTLEDPMRLLQRLRNSLRPPGQRTAETAPQGGAYDSRQMPAAPTEDEVPERTEGSEETETS